MSSEIQSINDLTNMVFIYGLLIGSVGSIVIMLVFEAIKASNIGKPDVKKPAASKAPAKKKKK